MKKIPLESTIVGSYKFLFTRILSVIGAAWLPLLVMIALCVGILYVTIPQAWWHGQFPVLDEKNPDPAAIWAFIQPIMIALPAIMVVAIVFSSMITIGLMRVALGQTKSCFIFFSLGGDVWRLVAAWILSFIIIMGIYLALIPIGVLGATVGKQFIPEGALIPLGVVLVAGGACLLIYIAVRLTFFLPAVAAAEHSIGLGRAWALGRGNFWRIFVVSLAVAIPVVIVGWIIQNIATASLLTGDFVKLAEQSKLDMAALFQAVLPMLPVFAAIQILQQIALDGLGAGAIAKAYQAVTAPDEVSA